ncbi:hypothetical protein ACI782_12895 [Geodermatophilus sp. SYSU D00703]
MSRHRLGDLDVWFGTTDAPAPEGSESDAKPGITVGVSLHAQGAVVGLRHRRAGGPWHRMRLQYSHRTDEAQYFTGTFPRLPQGAVLEYEVYLRCDGPRPIPEVRVGERASFQVLRSGAGPLVPMPTPLPPAPLVGWEPDADTGSSCGSFLSDLRARAADKLLWGAPAEPVAVPSDVFTCLFREALHPQRIPEGWAVWRDLDSEVALDVGRTRVALLQGFVVCGLRMRCDQVMDTSELTVPLATGTETEPSGLIMTGELAARGIPLLVDAWGEVAVVGCWTAVVDVASKVAAAAGTDIRGGPLLPGAVWTADDVFTVVPQARHAIDGRSSPVGRE